MKTFILSCFYRPRRLFTLIVLPIGFLTLPAVAHRLAAQTVSWTSSNQTVATVDANGTITAVSDGTATITTATEQNGKTVTSFKTIEVNLDPPPITVNSVKWAQGNVTFDPSSCIGGVCTKLMIAEDPYANGLYFQWYGGSSGGQVIGYAISGAWNVTPNPADTGTWRYVQPGAAFPGSWYGESSTGTVYHSVGTAKGNWIANNPCTLIGDGWRLPTKEEIIATHPTQRENSYSITGWAYNSANGGYLKHTATGLIFTLNGYRYGTSGTLTDKGSYGYYWAGTEGSSNTHVYSLNMYKSSGLQITINYKTGGFSVRCVKD